MDQLSDKKDMLDSKIVNALNACSQLLQRVHPNAGAELILFGSQVYRNIIKEGIRVA